MRVNMRKPQKFGKIKMNKVTMIEDMVSDYIANEGLIAFSVWDGNNCFPTQVGRIDNNGIPVVLEIEGYNKLRELLGIPKNTPTKKYYVDVDILIIEKLITHIGSFSQPKENVGYDFSGLKKIVLNKEWTGIEDYLNNYRRAN